MIPSLVAQHLRRSIVEYLSTTFAISDDDTRRALAAFLADPDDGIFRGPFLRMRTPFVSAADDKKPPLDWVPDGFRPFTHQRRAWKRLSSRKRDPKPTLVTTGTGSGKTECFLYPVLDHCVRERAAGRRGVKALVLYPMNALATDQARRLAATLAEDERLGSVRAGLFIGGKGSHRTATAEYLVDERNALVADPPDILLTNYKMLDRLLLRSDRRRLWRDNDPDTLRYVVLDEFHTYDGAQGTDVAMLLRRLGATLGMATDDAPLGRATPVATSATLGSGRGAVDALCEFAGRVFGVPFDEDSIVSEQRQTVDEACGGTEFELTVPDVDEILAVDEDAPDAFDQLAMLFTGADAPLDEVALGRKLRRHRLTRALLLAVGDRVRAWSDLSEAVVGSVPEWGPVWRDRPDAVGLAIARYVALLSRARREGDAALFPIEVQLWIREVSRLERAIAPSPTFRWADSARSERDFDGDAAAAADREERDDDGGDGPAGDGPVPPVIELPAVYCRSCGRSGWMGMASELDGSIRHNSREIYQASFSDRARLRAMIRASADEPDVRWLDTIDGRVHTDGGDARVPVLVTGADDPAKAEERARRSECPSCRNDDAITFLGSRVASLASVSISQIFGMDHRYVEDDERKLLAFVGSVQDASHRAGFFTGRTHRFNLRAAMAQVVRDRGETNLAEVGDEVMRRAVAAGPRDVFGLVPPDLLSDPEVATTWTAYPSEVGTELLARRVAFEAHLEFGLRSRLGRTLELAGACSAAVGVDHLDDIVELVRETHRHRTGQQVIEDTVPGYTTYLLGLLARMRLRGAILHPWLEPYIEHDGEQWHIWGGRPHGMKAFPSGQSRPAFVTTGVSRTFDQLNSTAIGGTWLLDWANRTLGVDAQTARTLTPEVFRVLAGAGVIVSRTTQRNHVVYGLDPGHVDIVDIDDPDELSMLRCTVCSDRFDAPPEHIAAWDGRPCLRYRCPGRYAAAPVDDANYYRRWYRLGEPRRVVAREHTSLLTRRQREKLEAEFKTGTAPDAANVITATPTLEMGIDIGDLSAVMLTAVPDSRASYVQRVGRAGRRSGNAFVTTFVRTDPRNLYYLSDPEAMIAGDIRPPNCYLDAIEILRRQFLAFLVDRVAEGSLRAPEMPTEIRDVAKDDDLGTDTWLGAVVAAGEDPALGLAARFCALFGDHLDDDTVAAVHDWASGGLREALGTALKRWRDGETDLNRRRNRLNEAVKRAESAPHIDDRAQRTIRSLNGERSAMRRLLREYRKEFTVNALERMGLLPNYTLVDDSVTLDVNMWSVGPDGTYDTVSEEYQRSGRQAVVEFAPGNTFYAGNHQFRIDSLDVGSGSEPLYEWWRLCPECGYGAPEQGDHSTATCPRCGQHGIADAGARHQLLRLRRAHSTMAEEAARVFDQSEERHRGSYDVVTSVDIDPDDITQAWRHTTETFGVEYARNAVIRTVNAGSSFGGGERIRIANEICNAAPFMTCRHCGSVDGVRDGFGGDEPAKAHQGWCTARSGANREDWQPLRLVHELRTEAVRMLLPLSDFEVTERLASFKAALMLGLRLDFGGEPDNIELRDSSFPNEGGQGRKRFVVLHDRVPGGTGYVERVADPQRLRRILELARDAISRCVCRNEGRRACHRCLLGTVEARSLEAVSRQVALDILDSLLARWEFTEAEGGSVTGIALSRVDESELERRWKVAIQAWADRPDTNAKIPTDPQAGRATSFELRIGDGDGDTAARYRITEQVEQNVTPQTVPDFEITRLDRPQPPICVYLDGFAFHASAQNNHLAHDAAKRQAVRDSGKYVWNMTWDDVNDFHEAVTAQVARKAPARPFVTQAQRIRGQEWHNRCKGAVDFALVDANPVQLLLDVLANPDFGAWERLALSAVAGAAATAERRADVDSAALRDAVRAALDGVDAPTSTTSPGDVAAQAFTFATPQGLVVRALLDAADGRHGDERWTVISRIPDGTDDVTSDDHVGRWKDWLQWANLLQFLGSDGTSGREAVVTTAVHAATFDIDDLYLTPGDADGTDRVRDERAPLAPAVEEELGYLGDTTTRTLVEAVLGTGAPTFVAGWPVPGPPGCGWEVEAAWPDHRVAVLGADDGAPTAAAEMLEWLADAGWHVRRADEWDADALVGALTSPVRDGDS